MIKAHSEVTILWNEICVAVNPNNLYEYICEITKIVEKLFGGVPMWFYISFVTNMEDLFHKPLIVMLVHNVVYANNQVMTLCHYYVS
jgi:hypothetical protein